MAAMAIRTTTTTTDTATRISGVDSGADRLAETGMVGWFSVAS